MSVQTIDPVLAETRRIQAQTLMQLAEMNGQHPTEIDPVLAEEILKGEVTVEGFTPAITVTPSPSQAFPTWAIAFASAAAGLGLGAVVVWWII